MNFELRKLLRSRAWLVNQLLLPLILIFILGTSLSGQVGGQSSLAIRLVKVGIVNQGAQGGGSVVLDGFLKAPELQEVIKTNVVSSRDTAVSRLRSGEYGYVIVVPPDFDQGLQQGKQARLEFILGKDHMDNLVAGTLFGNFLDQLNDMQAAALTLGPKSIAGMSPSSEQAANALKIGNLGEDGRSYSASQFYAVSMLLMFLMYCGLTVNISLFGEKEGHTLFRLNAMPVKGSQLFLGKMLGIGAVTIIQCACIILLSHWLFGVYWGNQPGLLILFCLLMILAAMTLAIVVGLFFKSGASARSCITLLTVCMTFISGGMAPLPQSWIHTVGAFTINHWPMDAILRMMLNENVSKILPNLLVMSLICLVLFGAALISYRKVGYHA